MTAARVVPQPRGDSAHRGSLDTRHTVCWVPEGVLSAVAKGGRRRPPVLRGPRSSPAGTKDGNDLTEYAHRCAGGRFGPVLRPSSEVVLEPRVDPVVDGTVVGAAEVIETLQWDVASPAVHPSSGEDLRAPGIWRGARRGRPQLLTWGLVCPAARLSGDRSSFQRWPRIMRRRGSDRRAARRPSELLENPWGDVVHERRHVRQPVGLGVRTLLVPPSSGPLDEG